MPNLAVQIIIQAKDLATKALNDLSKSLKDNESGFKALTIGGGVVAGALGLMGKSIIDRGAEFQKYRAVLQTVLKSQEAANKAIQATTEFAAKTPFQVGELVQANVQLTSLGLNAEKFLPIVGDFAASMQLDLVEASRAVGRALQGVPEGFEIMRNAGITNTRLMAAGWAGDTKDMEGRAKALLKVLATDFAGGMERQSATFMGAASNMQDALENIQRSLAANLMPTFETGIRKLTGFINKLGEMTDTQSKIVAWGGAGAFAVSAFTAAVGAAGLAIPHLLTGIGNAGKSLIWLSKNPVVLAVVAAGTLTAAILKLSGAFDDNEKKLIRSIEQAQKLEKQLAELESRGITRATQGRAGAQYQILARQLKEAETQATTLHERIKALNKPAETPDAAKNLADLMNALPEVMKTPVDEMKRFKDIGEEVEGILFKTFGPDRQEELERYNREQFDAAHNIEVLRRESNLTMGVMNEYDQSLHDLAMRNATAAIETQGLDKALKSIKITTTPLIDTMSEITKSTQQWTEHWTALSVQNATVANLMAETEATYKRITSSQKEKDARRETKGLLRGLEEDQIEKAAKKNVDAFAKVFRYQPDLQRAMSDTLMSSLEFAASVIRGDAKPFEIFADLGKRLGRSMVDALIDEFTAKLAASILTKYGMRFLGGGEGLLEKGLAFAAQTLGPSVGIGSFATSAATGGIDIIPGATGGPILASPPYQPVTLVLENRGESLAKGIFKTNRSRLARGEVDSGRVRGE